MHGGGGERADPVTELLHGHLLLVKVEPEFSLVVEILELGNIKTLCIFSVELGRDFLFGIVEFLEKWWLWIVLLYVP